MNDQFLKQDGIDKENLIKSKGKTRGEIKIAKDKKLFISEILNWESWAQNFWKVANDR